MPGSGGARGSLRSPARPGFPLSTIPPWIVLGAGTGMAGEGSGMLELGWIRFQGGNMGMGRDGRWKDPLEEQARMVGGARLELGGFQHKSFHDLGIFFLGNPSVVSSGGNSGWNGRARNSLQGL